MLIRNATLNDLTAIATVEAECFPPAEAATAQSIKARLAAYAILLWLLYEDD